MIKKSKLISYEDDILIKGLSHIKFSNENELIVHKGIICSKCGIFPIKGIRYKCPICIDINYCEKCHNKII